MGCTPKPFFARSAAPLSPGFRAAQCRSFHPRWAHPLQRRATHLFLAPSRTIFLPSPKSGSYGQRSYCEAACWHWMKPTSRASWECTLSSSSEWISDHSQTCSCASQATFPSQRIPSKHCGFQSNLCRSRILSEQTCLLQTEASTIVVLQLNKAHLQFWLHSFRCFLRHCYCLQQTGSPRRESLQVQLVARRVSLRTCSSWRSTGRAYLHFGSKTVANLSARTGHHNCWAWYSQQLAVWTLWQRWLCWSVACLVWAIARRKSQIALPSFWTRTFRW